MHLLKELKLAVFDAIIALRFIRKSSALWMSLYLLLAMVLFALVSWQVFTHEQAIKQLLLDYLFPQSWQGISEKILSYFYEQQAKVVIGNMILGASLVVASIFLFPIKEQFSAKFELDAGYQNGIKEEFPLWEQGLEEARLLILYLSAQSLILWIGYYPWPVTQWLSIGLSYLFLFFTFGIDFIAPTLQRHKLHYAKILKALAKRPVLVLSFGALFSSPVVLLSLWLFQQPELSLVEVSATLFLVNIVFLTLAIPAGTHVASHIIQQVRDCQLPTAKAIRSAYGLTILALVVTASLHLVLFKSVHHKTQLLKAEYSIDWGSFKLDSPSLAQLFATKSLSKLSFDLEIYNPTEFDIVIENAQLFVEKAELQVAQLDLDGFAVAAGQRKTITVKLDSRADFSSLNDFATLLEDWYIQLHVDIWPGLPFIMNIYQSSDSE